MKNRQLVLRGIIGFAAMTFLLFFALVLEGGHLGSQMHAGAFFIVVGGGGALVVAAYGFTPFKQLAQVLRGDDVDCWELGGSIKLVSITGPLLGVVGALLGCIHTMQNLSDPSKLGAGIAVAFISLLYGAFLGLAAYAFWKLVEKSQNTRKESQLSQIAENKSSLDASDSSAAASDGMSQSKVEPVNFGMTLMGLLGFVGCVLLGQGLEGGHASSLVHIGALLIGLGAPLLGAIVIHGFSEPWWQFVAVFSAEDGLAKDVSSIRAVLLFIIYASPLSGLIGVILGFIHVMENLSDPSKIGAGIAVSFVSLVYGLALSVIGYVLLAMIDRATADRKQPVPGLPRGESAYFAMTGLFILFSVFFVILYSLSDFDIQKCKEALALNTPANVDKKAKTENEKQDEKTIVVSWAFEKSENSDGIPEAKVYLKFEHFKYEGSDRVFVSKENAWPMKYEANADTGLSSSFWHAGAGSEFHAKKEGSNLVVYRQYVEEISPEAQEKGVVPPEREKLRSIPIPSDRRIRYETKEQ